MNKNSPVKEVLMALAGLVLSSNVFIDVNKHIEENWSKIHQMY